MDPLEKLRAQHAALTAEAKAITSSAKTMQRNLSEDEAAKVDEILAQVETVKEEIKIEEAKAQANADRQARLDAAVEFNTEPLPRISAPTAPEPTGNAVITGGVDSDHYDTFGEQLCSIYQAACPGATIDPRLTGPMATITGSGTLTASDGGFLIQPEFTAGIIESVFSAGAILPRVQNIPLGVGKNSIKINAIAETNRATGSRWGGVRVYRTAEGEQGTASKPKLRQIKLELKKLFGLWYATDELLSDASAMQAVASKAFPEEARFVIEDEIFRGDGGSQMLGILNTDCLVSVSKETDQEADTIVKENIDKMWARRLGEPVWFINRNCTPALESLAAVVGVGGVPAYLPPGGLSDTPYARLKGAPVIEVEYCESVGTVGDIVLADFSEYLMIDDGGLESARSMHLRFDYGEQVFRWILRNDGKTALASAITPYKGTGDTLSPFVALASRD